MARPMVEEKLDKASFCFRTVEVYEVLCPDHEEKRSKKFLFKFVFTSLLVGSYEIIYDMIIKKDIVIIAIGSQIMSMMVVILLVTRFKSTIIEIMEQGFDAIEEIYHPENIHVKHMGREIRERTHERDKFIVKLGRFLALESFTIPSLLGPAISYFFFGTKYPLQYPMTYLPFLEPVDFFSWLINFLVLAGIYFCAVSIFMFLFTLTLVALSNCVGQLETITEITKRRESIVEIDSHDEWVKITMDLMVKSRELLLLTQGSLELFMYYWEKVGYLAMLVSFAIGRLNPSYLGVLIPCLAIISYLFLIATANEIIKDRFEDLNTALYDIPWYDLKPKQRKDLILLIQWSQKETLISSGGLADMTYEWFLDLVERAYSGGLILMDLAK